MPTYTPQAIEARWQRYWQDRKTFATPDTAAGPKYYILDMFPYPSGSGLHVGHPEGYTATDILARYQRMKGRHVLHPMGWDAFGLPAEQYAIQTGTHPRVTTAKNVATFKRQIQSLGFSYDWDREVDTTDPAYVRWTQWIFLQLFDTWYDAGAQKGRPVAELPIPPGVDAERYRDSMRLAYQAEVPVNWCPALGTVLANEEVIDGKSERGSHPVERRPLRQWLLRITAYAERLLADLDSVDWPESIKTMQRDWIGRSEGAEVDFRVKGHDATIRVFTTRPDTLFGATYMVLSPEHALVDAITTPEQRDAVKAYQQAAARKSDMERTELAKTKSGVFTGGYAINPATNQPIPVWIADYVLATYGTGAIMAVPAQDERDWEFAEVYNLPIVRTVQPPEGWTGKAFVGEGPAINSDFLNGLGIAAAKAKMIDWLEAKSVGSRRVNYKLRDWLFSRQRYWGEPFPILHEVGSDRIRAVPEDQLPVTLPTLEDFKPTGSPEGPLVKATDWLTIQLDGKTYRRETNTMPQWAGSCWYYLRDLDPKNDTTFCDPAKAKHWLPVDLYVGGAEHAVLHLLYSRFWHKVLFDRGHVPTPEPFGKLVNQGMILGEVEYTRSDNGAKLSDDQVEKRGDGFVLLADSSVKVDARAHKMSKARGNVINPDDVVREYGADSLRLFEMFMGPLEQVKPWSMRGVEGVYRFLSRVWRALIDTQQETLALSPTVQDVAADKETLRLLHVTIKRVTDDLDGMRVNTAIAAMMEYTNHLTGLKVRPRAAVEPFVLLLAPFAPHIAEELWSALGHTDTLAYEPWPVADLGLLKADTVEVPVQVNGKLRAKLVVPADSDEKAIEALALADEKVQSNIAGKTVKKVIVAKGKLVNIVVVNAMDANDLGASRPLAPPLYPASVYALPDLDALDRIMDGNAPGYFYARDGHPNADALATEIARLENADWAIVTPSGMGAVVAALVPLLQAGDRVVASDRLYGRTAQLLQQELARFGVTTTWVDVGDLDGVRRALTEPARLLYVETISNPLLRVADLARLADLAYSHHARFVVDNTFATPALVKPLDLGADLVIESLTKFVGGHSDLTLGAVSGESEDEDLRPAVAQVASIWGLAAPAFDCWLATRSVATLDLRMRAACESATALADWLAKRLGVLKVVYPGRRDHPDYSLVRKQMPFGAGPMLCLELDGGRDAVNRFLRRAPGVPFSPSLGHSGTSLSYPAGTSHRFVDPAERKRQGITDGLLRLSVGVEPVEEIKKELARGLA